ncbi:peptidylprolyl isomerase [Sulfitobacter sp. SK012]|uniref:peptidylprolyl isomerase n=1 Tax=Sulfitobacter sp. SK012 TaxID=1389005 RepID=UPI000E0AA26F|nr:peptidylprolyl isomerase [Sulfitobacter sp. SK012]AXI46249.1 peptidylprolyl isomerase [Sulfitobacter sp. SK012]
MFKLISRPLVALAFTAAIAGSAAVAQNLFAPVATVNGAGITLFEVQQRQLFLTLLNAPNGDDEATINSLIDERLRTEKTTEAGLDLSEESILAAQEEFAGRAELDREEFIGILNQAGVSEETFRDFVVNGIVWRDYIRGRYGRRVEISEAEIDRALAQQNGGSSAIRVLLSEIIIPAPPERAAEVNAIAEQIADSSSAEQFSAYAREYSATASREQGGRLEWTPLNQLPPTLQPMIMSLSPGDVTAPLPIPDAVALFQLRAIEETSAPAREYSTIEYAAYYMAGGRSEQTLQQASNLRGQVDRCDDLYAFAKGQAESVLDREVKKPGELPQDFAIELSKLDPGEVSTALTRSDGQALVFLMLCGRTAMGNSEVSREDVAEAIRQRRLAGFADSLLAQLRAEARIVRK